MLEKIRKYFYSLTEYKCFEEVYSLLFMFIALFSWRFDTMIGMGIILFIMVIVLIIYEDFNYIIPPTLYLLFCINEGFSNDEIPISLIILVSVLVLIMLFFFIKNIKKNGLKLKKMKSFWGLLGLAIMNLIPILWCDTIESPNEVFYFFFFANLGYFIVYLLIMGGLNKVDLKLLAVAISYMAILITCECIYRVYDLRDTKDSIFDLWYYLGWGLCNEAGIMICFSIPFIFYLLSKSNKILPFIAQFIKITFVLVGVLLTTSRGAYLCAFGETFILMIALIFTTKIRKQYLVLLGCLVVICLSVFFVFHDYTFSYVETIIDRVFTEGLDDNGRLEIWQQGVEKFLESPLYTILGAGICAVLQIRTTSGGTGESLINQLTPLVFHSTIVQTLVMGGIFGLVMLLIHLFLKYKNIIKLGLPFILSVGIGFICLDMYGLIDNTYHMYYFMIPLVIVLAVMDNACYKESNKI